MQPLWHACSPVRTTTRPRNAFGPYLKIGLHPPNAKPKKMLHMQWSMCNVFLEVSSVIGWCTVEFALLQPKPATIVSISCNRMGSSAGRVPAFSCGLCESHGSFRTYSRSTLRIARFQSVLSSNRAILRVERNKCSKGIMQVDAGISMDSRSDLAEG